MTYQNQTIPQHDNADESSLFLTDVAASPSSLSLGQEEAMAAKKQKHARIFCVAGSLLLVAAGRYSAGAATGAATGAVTATGSAGSNKEQEKEEPGGYGCEKAVGTFQKRSCVPKDWPSLSSGSFCIDGAGESYSASDGAYESCFGMGTPDGKIHRCWTKYSYISEIKVWDSCRPDDADVAGTWHYAKPLPDGSCGDACDFGFMGKFLPTCDWCIYV